jgi:hypothetical protein
MWPLSWIRRHAVTFLGPTIVFIAIVLAQTQRSGGFFFHSYGWPVTAVLWQGDYSRMMTATPVSEWVEYHWRARGLLIDAASSLLLLFSTAVCCERLRRRRLRPYQFGISDALAGATVLAVLLSYHLYEDRLYAWYGTLTGDISDFWGDLAGRPWHMQLPISSPLAIEAG